MIIKKDAETLVKKEPNKLSNKADGESQQN